MIYRLIRIKSYNLKNELQRSKWKPEKEITNNIIVQTVIVVGVIAMLGSLACCIAAKNRRTERMDNSRREFLGSLKRAFDRPSELRKCRQYALESPDPALKRYVLTK